MDEKVVFVNGEMMYDMNSKDHITEYITAHLFVESRTLEKCVEFLRQIRLTCYEQILEIYKKEKHNKVKKRKLITFVSDGFENYRNAFNKLFLYVGLLLIIIAIITSVVSIIEIKGKELLLSNAQTIGLSIEEIWSYEGALQWWQNAYWAVILPITIILIISGLISLTFSTNFSTGTSTPKS